MAWTYDAPSGTYKNHALSKNIRREAVADSRVMPFMTPESGFGKRRGESVTITRVLQLPLARRINETETLPSGRPAIETKQVSISQWGFKIPITELEQQLSHFDILNPFQAALRDQIRLTMDDMAADALKLTPIKYVPMATGFNLDTDGTPTGTSDRNLGVQDLRRIHDYLHGTLKAPKRRGGNYVGILSTRAARGIKNDPLFQEWQAPTTSAPFMDGMIRNVEGFDLIESNHFEAFADLVGASTTTGEAIFFGADAGGLVEVMAPELRMGMPEELGTKRDVGWVGTLEAFLVWERPALARVVHVTSA